MSRMHTSMLGRRDPDARGYFGEFGGRFVPETLVAPLEELERAYLDVRDDDPAFSAELEAPADALTSAGRRRCTKRARLAAAGRRARAIYLKREDLTHTGAHKINNALGQALLAKRMGKQRIIAETGAGQHGVATATACALLGLECVRLHGRRGHGAAGAQRRSACGCSAPRSAASTPAAGR